MIYLDSSVALARLLFESRAPALEFWEQQLVSSRLLEYEVLDMNRTVLARALQPWPMRVRTLDALHLATAESLRGQGESVELASYDNRIRDSAQALGIAIAAL